MLTVFSAPSPASAVRMGAGRAGGLHVALHAMLAYLWNSTGSGDLGSRNRTEAHV